MQVLHRLAARVRVIRKVALQERFGLDAAAVRIFPRLLDLCFLRLRSPLLFFFSTISPPLGFLRRLALAVDADGVGVLKRPTISYEMVIKEETEQNFRSQRRSWVFLPVGNGGTP